MIVYVASVRDTLKDYGLTLTKGDITVRNEDDPTHWLVEYNSKKSVNEHYYIDKEYGKEFNMYNSLMDLLVSISVNQSLSEKENK